MGAGAMHALPVGCRAVVSPSARTAGVLAVHGETDRRDALSRRHPRLHAISRAIFVRRPASWRWRARAVERLARWRAHRRRDDAVANHAGVMRLRSVCEAGHAPSCSTPPASAAPRWRARATDASRRRRLPRPSANSRSRRPRTGPERCASPVATACQVRRPVCWISTWRARHRAGALPRAQSYFTLPRYARADLGVGGGLLGRLSPAARGFDRSLHVVLRRAVLARRRRGGPLRPRRRPRLHDSLRDALRAPARRSTRTSTPAFETSSADRYLPSSGARPCRMTVRRRKRCPTLRRGHRLVPASDLILIRSARASSTSHLPLGTDTSPRCRSTPRGEKQRALLPPFWPLFAPHRLEPSRASARHVCVRQLPGALDSRALHPPRRTALLRQRPRLNTKVLTRAAPPQVRHRAFVGLQALRQRYIGILTGCSRTR